MPNKIIASVKLSPVNTVINVIIKVVAQVYMI